jgi:hypothetical protein
MEQCPCRSFKNGVTVKPGIPSRIISIRQKQNGVAATSPLALADAGALANGINNRLPPGFDAIVLGRPAGPGRPDVTERLAASTIKLTGKAGLSVPGNLQQNDSHLENAGLRRYQEAQNMAAANAPQTSAGPHIAERARIERLFIPK